MVRIIDHVQEIGQILETVGAIKQGEYDLVGREQKRLEAETGKKPLSGEVLTGKKGNLGALTTDKVLHSCLAAQAAERTIWAGEEHGDDHIKAPVKDGKFQIEDSNFTRSYIGKDASEPKALIQSQAVGHLAALLDGATQVDPSLNNNEAVKEAKAGLQVIGAHHYLASAKMLKDGALELNDPNKKEFILKTASEMERQGKEIIKANPEISYNSALIQLHDSLQVAAETLPEDQKKAFNDVVAKREAQVTLDISAHKLSDNLEKTQDGKGSNDTQAIINLERQFGLASKDSPKGHLSSSGSNKMITDMADIAQGGVTLGEIGQLRNTLNQARDDFRTKGDEGVSMSAKDLAEVRNKIANDLKR